MLKPVKYVISKAIAGCCLRSEGQVCWFLSRRLLGLLFSVVIPRECCIDVDNDVVAFCIVLQSYARSLWGVREAIGGTFK